MSTKRLWRLGAGSNKGGPWATKEAALSAVRTRPEIVGNTIAIENIETGERYDLAGNPLREILDHQYRAVMQVLGTIGLHLSTDLPLTASRENIVTTLSQLGGQIGADYNGTVSVFAKATRKLITDIESKDDRP